MDRRRFLILGSLSGVVSGLAACGAPVNDFEATPDVVTRTAYRHDGPPRLTLFTMVSNSSGSGAHSSLMVSASQRVIFDPAGTVRISSIPEQGDVLFGITPYIADFYTRAHARKTYHVVVQELDVSAGVAELALQRVLANGSVAKAHCTKSTSAIMRSLPGFDGISQTWYPNKLAEQFGKMPGVKTQRLYEYDEDDKSKALRAYGPEA